MKDNHNLPLLYDVREDAFVKAKGIMYDERFFCMIYHMDNLIRIAEKEGLLALEEAAAEIPSETEYDQDIQYAVSYVCDGMDAEDITEILTARYWIKDLQGEEALLYFMMILSVLRMQDGASPYLLESLLVACLSNEAAQKYAAYKKQRESAKPEQPLLQRLLDSDPRIEKGGILVVKDLLEAKVEQADAKILKKVIRDAKENDFVIALKGLSVPAKKKLFSVIPSHKAEAYAANCEYMGPVRQIDVLASFAELIAIFERQ